jgi:hypothetical protein
MEIIMAIALRSWSPVGVAMAAALVAACGSQTDTGAAVTSSAPPTNPAAVTSPAATGSPTPTPAAFGQGGGTGGRIDADALRAGKITVPPWTGPTKEIAQQCASGRLILSEPTYDTFVTELATVVFANLDGDPAVETAALIRCRYGEASEKMVVAFDRDRTGAIVMLGKLVEGHIWTVKPASGGGVTVDISDTQSCCSMSADNEFHQTRTYAWTGTAYRQTAGPTSWAGKPYVTDLVITGSPIVFGPAKDGRRMGTFTEDPQCGQGDLGPVHSVAVRIGRHDHLAVPGHHRFRRLPERLPCAARSGRLSHPHVHGLRTHVAARLADLRCLGLPGRGARLRRPRRLRPAEQQSNPRGTPQLTSSVLEVLGLGLKVAQAAPPTKSAFRLDEPIRSGTPSIRQIRALTKNSSQLS